MFTLCIVGRAEINSFRSIPNPFDSIPIPFDSIPFISIPFLSIPIPFQFVQFQFQLIKLKSEYYSVEELCCFLDKHNNKLTLLSLNIDSLNYKYDELCILVDTLAKSNVQISLICIQEAIIQSNANINHLKLNN